MFNFRRSNIVRRSRAVMPTSSPLDIQLGLVSLEEAQCRRDIIYRPIRLLPTPSSPQSEAQPGVGSIAHKFDTNLIPLRLAAKSDALKYRGL